MSDAVGGTGVSGVSAGERGVGEMPDKRGAEALSRDKTDARTKNSRNNHVEGEDGRCSRAMRGNRLEIKATQDAHIREIGIKKLRRFFKKEIFGFIL